MSKFILATRNNGRLLGRIVLLALCCWLGWGCRSSKAPGGGPSEGLVSVLISGHEALDTARAISEVFQAAGYKPFPLRANKDLGLAFEKPGGAGATLLYGDWDPNKVWYRVRVRLSPLSQDSQLVSCNVYRVTDHGDAHFETEHKLAHARRGPYRELLNQAKAQLDAVGK